MRVHLHDGAVPFLAAADRFFRSDPFSANVIAVCATRIAAGTQPEGHDYLWATVDDGDSEVLGVAMHTPPHALFVSHMPQEAAAALSSALAGAGRNLPGVNGACESTVTFAEVWAARTGQASSTVTAMRMYRLGELSRPRQVPGGASLAAADDTDPSTRPCRGCWW